MLEVIGFLAVTGVLAYFTLVFFALLLISDESLINTIMWNWQPVLVYFVSLVVGWVLWWLFIGSTVNINVSFG